MQKKGRRNPKKGRIRCVCVGGWVFEGRWGNGKRAFKMQLCNHLVVTKEEKEKSVAKKPGKWDMKGGLYLLCAITQRK